MCTVSHHGVLSAQLTPGPHTVPAPPDSSADAGLSHSRASVPKHTSSSSICLHHESRTASGITSCQVLLSDRPQQDR